MDTSKLLRLIYIICSCVSSYAARMWGNLIRNPSKLFDVVVPPYVEDSMGVIAQVFEDCVAASSPKFNKVGTLYCHNNNLVCYKIWVK